ncbi:MAG: DNA mismatch endonuclease Vsr [Phycisphaeraceae bacterium]|nr:DNA mismatch endonuclease Vsr [Phycisphaeraceae bacterium]
MSRWPGNPNGQPTTFGGLSRAELMSRVRSRGNQTTEARLATMLRRAGISGWRRHLPLPGRPDFAWPTEKVAVFVDGCFWHGHDCGRSVVPKTNTDRWREKIESNRARDRRIARDLRKKGWGVLRVWECQLSKNPDRCVSRIKRALEQSSATTPRTR